MVPRILLSALLRPARHDPLAAHQHGADAAGPSLPLGAGEIQIYSRSRSSKETCASLGRDTAAQSLLGYDVRLSRRQCGN